MTKDTTTLYNGRWLRLKKRGSWEYVERTNPIGAAVIVGVTPEGKLLLVEQFRVPIQARTIEFPAGLIGDNGADEAPELAAARELEEETGWRAGLLQFVQGGPTSAGMSTETMQFYRASRLLKVAEGGGISGEDIIVHEVLLAQAPQFIAKCAAAGFCIDPKVYAGIYFTQFDATGEPLASFWWRQ